MDRDASSQILEIVRLTLVYNFFSKTWRKKKNLKLKTLSLAWLKTGLLLLLVLGFSNICFFLWHTWFPSLSALAFMKSLSNLIFFCYVYPYYLMNTRLFSLLIYCLNVFEINKLVSSLLLQLDYLHIWPFTFKKSLKVRGVGG